VVGEAGDELQVLDDFDLANSLDDPHVGTDRDVDAVDGGPQEDADVAGFGSVVDLPDALVVVWQRELLLFCFANEELRDGIDRIGVDSVERFAGFHGVTSLSPGS